VDRAVNARSACAEPVARAAMRQAVGGFLRRMLRGSRQRLLILMASCSVFVAQPSLAQTSVPLASPGLPDATQYSAGVVHDWMELATRLAQQTPGTSPPVAARALAYLSLALYESVVPGIPGGVSLTGQLNELESLPLAQPDEALHWPTVANAALATMTRMMFAKASAEFKQRIDELERSAPLRHGRDFSASALTAERVFRSETHGRLIAMALMTWARTDGGHDPLRRLQGPRVSYVPPSGAGKWSATPPSFETAVLPWWGENRPFALQAEQCVIAPPLPYSEQVGSPFYNEAAEVLSIAKAATPQQRQFALYWADEPGKTPTPAGHWVFIANDVLKLRKASLAQAASTLVQLNLAMSDAFVAAWRAKYQHNLLRPVTYVQLVIDSRWTPELMDTPPFPEYPSAHSVQSGAAAAVLSALFGAKTGFTDNTHNDRGWGPRQFSSFEAAAEEASLSRLYAGIHFRRAVVQGQTQGRCVAQRVLQLRTYQP
jgi:hypothetical protein